MIASNMKLCPGPTCGRKVEKRGGCNHMTCILNNNSRDSVSLMLEQARSVAISSAGCVWHHTAELLRKETRLMQAIVDITLITCPCFGQDLCKKLLPCQRYQDLSISNHYDGRARLPRAGGAVVNQPETVFCWYDIPFKQDANMHDELLLLILAWVAIGC